MVAKFPIIGLNQDDDDVNLKPGWCREIWNAIPKNGFSKSGIQNIKGTIVRTNDSLPSGTNTCIGAFTDKANNRIVYFIHNSNNDHGIWYFSPNDNTHTLVLQTSFHNFSLTYPIKSCSFIEGIIEYTDGNPDNEPRSLIVTQAIANGYDFNDQASFNKQISLHKVRPDLPPLVQRLNGVAPNFGFNNITSDSYQFCFKYVYNDNSESKISPLSKLNWADIFPNSSNINNYIQVVISVDDDIKNIIKKVYFLYIKNGRGAYQLFKEATLDELTPAGAGTTATHSGYLIEFYANETTDAVFINNVNFIPNKTDNTLIHNQRSYTTMNEFDYEEWDGSISVGKTAWTSGTPRGMCLPNSSVTIGVLFFDEFGRTPGVTKSSSVSFGNILKTYGTTSLSSGVDQLRATWSLSGTPPSWAKSYALTLKPNNTFQTYFTCLVHPMFYKTEDLDNATGATEFTIDRKHFYETAPSSWTDKNIHWYLPINLPFVLDGQYKLRLLNNLTGSAYYVEDIISVEGNRIISKGFGVTNWNAALGTSFGLVWVALELRKERPDEQFFEIGQHYDCSDGLLTTTSGIINGEYHYIHSKLHYEPFSWGDNAYLGGAFRARFFGITNNANPEYGKPILTDVISKSPTNSSVKLENIITTEVKENSTTETLNAIEQATASIFPGFIALAQATNTNLLGNIAESNSSESRTSISDITNVYTVDYNKSCSDFGRSWVDVKNKKVSTEPNTLAISDPYIINSKVNGLFDYNNIFQIPIERTPIKKLINVESSNIFLAIHERNTTSLATYSGDNILHTTDGTQLIGDGKSIIGYDNELKGSYGTIYPDSVQSVKGRVYFFDTYQGEVLRYANNGTTPLASTYKMKNFFRTQGDIFIDPTNRNVITGYDAKLDILYITFKSSDPGEEVTLAFVDRQGEERWIMMSDIIIPERYAFINERLFGFSSGQIWELNVNSTYNLFFGNQGTTRIKHLFNSEISIEKKLMNIHPESNKKWVFNPILTDRHNPVTEGKIEQETRLSKSNFVRRDNGFYADLKRDVNTVSGLLPPGKSALTAGQPLIGKVYEINLENDDTTLVELDFLNYGFIPQSGQNIV